MKYKSITILTVQWLIQDVYKKIRELDYNYFIHDAFWNFPRKLFVNVNTIGQAIIGMDNTYKIRVELQDTRFLARF